MKLRTVVYAPRARADIARIYSWISDRAGTTTALRYVHRIRSTCLSLERVAERGTRRDEIRAGLRTIGFQRRVTIAFTVGPTEVMIQRVFYGGQNWAAEIT